MLGPHLHDDQSNSTEGCSMKTALYINAGVTIFILLFAVIGNLVIIAIYVGYKEVRSMNNLVVTISSVTDLLRAIVVMTIKTYNHLALEHDLVEPLCTITALTSAFAFVISPLLLALIAFIRYNIIVPSISQRFRLTHKRLYIMIAAIIATSSLFAMLPIFGAGYYVYSIHHGVCFAPWMPANLAFRTIFYILVVGVSLPILTVCYVKLYLLLRKHKQIMESNKKLARITSANGQSVETISHENNSITLKANIDDTKEKRSCIGANIGGVSRKRSKIAALFKKKAERKARSTSNQNMDNSNRNSNQEYKITKLMIVVFIAYCICWMPAAVVNIIALADISSVPGVWLMIIVTMVELNSGLNPLIYGFGNKQYRKAFKKMTGISNRGVYAL